MAYRSGLSIKRAILEALRTEKPQSLSAVERRANLSSQVLRRHISELEYLGVVKLTEHEESAKTGRPYTTAELTRERAERHLHRVRAEDSAWCFPAKQDISRPVDVWVMSSVLRRAYVRAGLEPLKGGLWHPWRRKWATERKHLPLRDVAAAGGWRDPTTLLTCYQQPDEETIERVVLGAPKLMSRPARGETLSPSLSPGVEVSKVKKPDKAGEHWLAAMTGVGVEPTTY